MKRFTNTKFFRALQGMLQKGIETDIRLVENRYNKFVKFLFSDYAASTDKVAYHNALVYTLVEFSDLTEVSGKKRS
jgi:hypothetical protein